MPNILIENYDMGTLDVDCTEPILKSDMRDYNSGEKQINFSSNDNKKKFYHSSIGDIRDSVQSFGSFSVSNKN